MRRTNSKRACRFFLETLQGHLSQGAGAGQETASDIEPAIARWLESRSVALRATAGKTEFDWLDADNSPVALAWVLWLYGRSRDVKPADWPLILQYGLRSVEPKQQELLQRAAAIMNVLGDWSGDSALQPLLDYLQQHDVVEWLLTTVQPGRRKSLRYYATPQLVADAMISLVEQRSERKGEAWGWSPLANWRILDPAAGSALFPRRLLQHWLRQFHQNSPPNSIDFSKQLLQRMDAIDIDPWVACAGSLLLTIDMQKAGFELARLPAWAIRVGDALRRDFLQPGYGVVIGNPPYAALTQQTNAWCHQLLAGAVDGISYLPANNQQGRRKNWLHDDYIKFLRLGQYLLSSSGTLCLVTNRSFLDGKGFTVLREQMNQSFAVRQFLDLQFPAREAGVPADDGRLFSIGSGVAIGLWSRRQRNLEEVSADHFSYCRLHGSVKEKQSQLYRPRFTAVPRNGDDLRWVPETVDARTRQEYAAGIPLDHIFDESWSAIVTARDRVVIDTDRVELEARLARLADPCETEETLRETYFSRTRSTRYQRGDTRGWRLKEAREKLYETDWRSYITRCLYRPLDPHWIFLHEDWIDWPRSRDVQTLRRPGNVGLVVRRAAPPGPYAFFAVSKLPVVDGVLRSDNRGNETVFNLYGRSGESNIQWTALESVRRQLNLELIHECTNQDSLWNLGDHTLANQLESGRLSSETVLCWIYAQLWESSYRTRFADCLTRGLPRITWPTTRAAARHRLILGQQRIALELSNDDDQAHPAISLDWQSDHFEIERRKIGYSAEDGRVRINSSNSFGEIDPSVWEYRQGAYLVLQKFLKMRSGRNLEGQDRVTLERLVARIVELQQLESPSHVS